MGDKNSIWIVLKIGKQFWDTKNQRFFRVQKKMHVLQRMVIEGINMMKNLIFVLLFGLFLIAGCSQTTTPSSAVPAPGQEDVEEKVVAGLETEGEVKEFDIIAKQFEFVPDTITVNQGDRVELHIESVDVTHGFALPEFGINERLNPGRDVHVNFVADKKGTFSFYCSVPCGSGHGRMSGQLIVK